MVVSMSFPLSQYNPNITPLCPKVHRFTTWILELAAEGARFHFTRLLRDELGDMSDALRTIRASAREALAVEKPL